MKKISILFIIVFLCWTCTGFEGCIPGSNLISGIVTDSAGKPIEGAVVRVVFEYDYSGAIAEFEPSMFTAAITNSSGYYETICYATSGIFGGVKEGKVYAIKRDYEIKPSTGWANLDTGLFMSCISQHEQTINFTLNYEKWTSSGIITGRALYTGESIARIILPTRDINNLQEMDPTIISECPLQGVSDNIWTYRFENLDFGRYELWPVGTGGSNIEVEVWPNNPEVIVEDWK